MQDLSLLPAGQGFKLSLKCRFFHILFSPHLKLHPLPVLVAPSEKRNKNKNF